LRGITPEEAYVEIERLNLELRDIIRKLRALEEKVDLILEFLGGEESMKRTLSSKLSCVEPER